jgi:hypothetical protein
MPARVSRAAQHSRTDGILLAEIERPRSKSERVLHLGSKAVNGLQALSGFVVAVAIGLLASSRTAPAKDHWAIYSNPRFGTTADYPADLFTVQDPPPENGDGASFRTADGRAQLSIFGAYNVENDTPQGYVKRNDELNSATYKRVTSEFYVVSGTTGADIYYDRCNFPAKNNDVLNCIHTTYPAREKALWDAIVTRISKSLRAGPH